MRVLEFAIHGWDLASAICADEELEPDLVEYLWTISPLVERGRQEGFFSAPIGEGPRGGSPQGRLLHALGRRTNPR